MNDLWKQIRDGLTPPKLAVMTACTAAEQPGIHCETGTKLGDPH
jgi:hypothetical protein